MFTDHLAAGRPAHPYPLELGAWIAFKDLAVSCGIVALDGLHVYI